MIFITLGSQKFQFDRLLKEVDNLIEKKCIKEEVFAQIGNSTYIPKNYEYSKFLDRDQFTEYMGKADKVITHGGTGAIVTAIKNDKKTIAIARLKEFKEHVDDHQLQIVKQFKEMKLIESIDFIEELDMKIKEIEFMKFRKYESNTVNIIESIESFIDSI